MTPTQDHHQRRASTTAPSRRVAQQARRFPGYGITECLRIASAGLTIDYPQPAEHYRPRLLRDGAAVTEVFETLLHDAVGC